MRVNHFSTVLGTVLLCLVITPQVSGQEVVNFGRLFAATSAADIDTTATFPGDIQGINLGNVTQFGPLTADETIGGVTLLRQDNAAVAGIIVNPDPSGIAGQTPSSLVGGADEAALNRVSNFGEFGEYDVSFPVTAGSDYKVQVLQFESLSITRTFDLTIDGAVAIDEFSVIGNNGDRQDAISGVNFGAFTVYEAIVSAAGSTLVVGVDPGESSGQLHPLAAQDPENFSGLTIIDTNPFLHAIIVERVPEPTTTVVLLTGLACCGLVIRRR
jgi:hypothetical protein